MLNESNYYMLYVAKLRAAELIRIAEMERSGREALSLNRKKGKNAVITHILEGAGNTLISAGNRLLKIA